MKQFFYLSLTFLFFLAGQSLFGQDATDIFTRKHFKKDMTNVDVIDAKIWHHQGLTEKSLKKGLEIISSNVPLTAVDSFNTYQVLAYNFRTLGANGLALEHAKKAIEIMHRMEPNDDSKITWIALYYLSVKQYNTAILFMKKNIPQLEKEKDTLSLLKLYNDIGFTYSLNGETDRAISYYNRVVQFKNQAEVYKGVIGLATGNLGAIYFGKEDYKKALRYIQIDAALSKGRNQSSYYNALNSIGECYFFIGDYNAAKNTLLQLESFNSHEVETKLKTYQLLADVFSKLKENERSVLYLKKYIVLKESIEKDEIAMETIFKELSDAKISGVRKDLELSQSKTIAEEFKNKAYLFALLLVVVAVIIFIAYYRKRQLKNAEIRRLETDLLSAELKNKKRDVTNMVTNLTYKRKFIDEVQDKLKELHSQPPEEIDKEVTLIIREFNNYKNADKNSAVLQTDIDKVNLAFFNKLGELFPDLTENEKELCGLLLLKFSSKDIGNIRNVTPNAIKKARQRIRKKLPISEEEDLIHFLENI